MADITYCTHKGCPFRDCERHPNRVSKAARDGRGYVSVADLAGACRRYIGYLVDKEKEETP